MSHQTYTIKQLRELATEQSYKFACLFDSKDKKVNNYNTHQMAISKQFGVIENRLKSPVLPDGIYFVGMCEKYGRGQIVDKFPIMKGSGLSQNANHYTILQPNNSQTENVLSYESALAMQKENAKLENQVNFLTQQNLLLQDKINDLDSELKESVTTLSEFANPDGTAKVSPLMEMGKNAGTWLKEISPMLAPLADRYFDLQEKKIDLEAKKIEAKTNPKQNKPVAEKRIQVGSKEFLDYVRRLHEENDEEELNKCLDLLEQNFNEQYVEICEELDLFDDDDEKSEEVTNG